MSLACSDHMPVFLMFKPSTPRLRNSPSIPSWVCDDALFRLEFEELWANSHHQDIHCFDANDLFEECAYTASKNTIRKRRKYQSNVKQGIDQMTVLLKTIHSYDNKSKLSIMFHKYPFLKHCQLGDDHLPTLHSQTINSNHCYVVLYSYPIAAA